MKLKAVLNSMLILLFTLIITGTINAGGGKKFKEEAKRLSTDLMQQVGFSLEKASDVENILIEYKKDIKEARKEFIEASDDEASEVVGSDDASVDIDLEGILGDDVESYYVDTTPELLNEYKEADREADEEIVELLSEDQVTKYTEVKGKWWKDVKDVVFSPEYSKDHSNSNKNK